MCRDARSEGQERDEGTLNEMNTKKEKGIGWQTNTERDRNYETTTNQMCRIGLIKIMPVALEQ